jgi:hypothetical protein
MATESIRKAVWQKAGRRKASCIAIDAYDNSLSEAMLGAKHKGNVCYAGAWEIDHCIPKAYADGDPTIERWLDELWNLQPLSCLEKRRWGERTTDNKKREQKRVLYDGMPTVISNFILQAQSDGYLDDYGYDVIVEMHNAEALS